MDSAASNEYVFKEVFGETRPTLPLSLSANIICANAIEIDWNKFCPKIKDEIIFIIGNPPTREQDAKLLIKSKI